MVLLSFTFCAFGPVSCLLSTNVVELVSRDSFFVWLLFLVVVFLRLVDDKLVGDQCRIYLRALVVVANFAFGCVSFFKFPDDVC